MLGLLHQSHIWKPFFTSFSFCYLCHLMKKKIFMSQESHWQIYLQGPWETLSNAGEPCLNNLHWQNKYKNVLTASAYSWWGWRRGWGGWRCRGGLQGACTFEKAKWSSPQLKVSQVLYIIWFQWHQRWRSRHTCDPVGWWRSPCRHSAADLCSPYQGWRNRGGRRGREMPCN